MSYFSEQLRRLIAKGHTQVELADAARISQGQFSKYINATSRPDRGSLNRLCKALPEFDRAQLIMAHLRDEIPECSRDLVIIAPRVPFADTSARVREEPEVPLPPDVQAAFKFFERLAQHDHDVADWIVSTHNLMKAGGKV